MSFACPVYGFSKKCLIESGRITEGELEDLRRCLQKEGLPTMSDEQIALFSLSCDNDVEETVNAIRASCKAKNDAPELFDKRDVLLDESLRELLGHYLIGVSPKRTEDGSVLVFINWNDISYRDFRHDDSIKLMLMAIECALYDFPPNGLIIFIDVKGVSLMHLTKFKIGTVQKVVYYLQEGLPVKLRAVHIMNSVYFMDKIMALYKPFMKKEVYNLIHFHSSSVDLGEFHKNFVPKELLPQEYGGLMPPMARLHEDFCQKLAQLRDFFAAEEQQRKSSVQA